MGNCSSKKNAPEKGRKQQPAKKAPVAGAQGAKPTPTKPGDGVKAPVQPPVAAWEGQLRLRTITRDPVPVEVKSTMKVSELKQKVAEKTNCSADVIRFAMDGKELQDAKTLAEQQVTEQSMVVLLFRLTDADREQLLAH